MARIPRKFRKIFASAASNNGQFGSGQAGTKILSSDPDVIQALPAYETGWNSATLGSRMFPALEEMQSQGFLDSRDIAYLYQEGIPEYNAQTSYYQYSIVKKAGTYELYGSIIDDNLGNPLPVAVNNANWKFLVDLSLPNNTPYGVSTNSGNAYAVTTTPTITTLPVGKLLLVKFNAANTGAATLNPNASTDIPLRVNNAALVGGEIKAGAVYPVIYDGTVLHLSGANPIYADSAQTIAGVLSDRAVTPAGLATLTTTESRRGLVELATAAETVEGLDTTCAITPAALLAAFDQQRAPTGFVTLPGGIIIQWTYITAFTGGSVTWTFPKAFTTQVFITLASNDSNNIQYAVGATPISLTQALVTSSLTSSPDSIYVLAIGY